MGEGEGRRCGGGEGMWGREESRRQMGLAGDRWVWHDVDRSPAGWSEMAAQAACRGGCSPDDGELACRSQVVSWVPAPMGGQGCRGGQGVMQLSVLWWVSAVGVSQGAERGERV